MVVTKVKLFFMAVFTFVTVFYISMFLFKSKDSGCLIWDAKKLSFLSLENASKSAFWKKDGYRLDTLRLSNNKAAEYDEINSIWLVPLTISKDGSIVSLNAMIDCNGNAEFSQER